MKKARVRLCGCWTVVVLLMMAASQVNGVTLQVDGTSFTLDGKKAFLLGISYYGALGAAEEVMRRDLEDMQRYGFNWIRVWATWGAFGNDVSAVDGEGGPREPFLRKLQWLVAECDRRGLVVDVTLSRGDKTKVGLATPEAHRRAVATLVAALKPHRNWYLDLANERSVRDARFVSFEELKQLRETVKRLDPQRLVTASDGSDISRDALRAYLLTANVDFVCPHRPRHPQSPEQTQTKSREYLAWMKDIGRVVPLHYQEPFRRGYDKWEPPAEAFLADLGQAKAGGAAGWCFHNGGQSDKSDGRPRRSFDLREQRLFEQLDADERRFLAGLHLRGAVASGRDPERKVTVAVLQAGLNHSKDGNPGLEVLTDPSLRPPWTEVFMDDEGRPQTREQILKRFGGRYAAHDPGISTNKVGRP